MRSFLLVMLLLVPCAFAAQLTGTAYTDTLQVAQNTILTINTVPAQQVLMTDGTYNLTVPKGSYQLVAVHMQNGHRYEDRLNITVIDNGVYTYDLILFRAEENASGVDLPPVEDIQFPDTTVAVQQSTLQPVLVLLLLAVLVALALTLSRRRWWVQKKATPQGSAAKETPVADDLQHVIAIIRRNGGRITQKELRKEMPVSEAKISMMIAELESQGTLKKIKQGRGNILVLK